MTVEELITCLARMPKNVPVTIRHDLAGSEQEIVLVEYNYSTNTVILREIG